MPRVLCVGLATLDVVQRVERLPGPDEKVVARRLDVAAGGPAAGAALTAAALGADALLLTALGRHPLAALVHEDLDGLGVRVLDATPGRTAPPAVSTVAVLEVSGERSVVSVNAEGVSAGPPEDLASTVGGCDVLLLDGHHPALALSAARAARDSAVPVVLDAGSWKPNLPELLPFVDLAACSQVFGLPGGEPVSALLDRGPLAVAVTRGGGAVGWWTADGAGEVAVPAVPVRDTLGAGDAFHGALAVALAGVRPADVPAALEPALRLAVAVAGVRVQHPGPRAWLTAPHLQVIMLAWRSPPG